MSKPGPGARIENRAFHATIRVLTTPELLLSKSLGQYLLVVADLVLFLR